MGDLRTDRTSDGNVNALATLANSAIAGASITVGAEDGDDVTVNIQLTDAEGDDLAEIGVVTVFVSDAATGIGVAATAPDGGIAAGTDGAILAAVVAGKVVIAQSEADGDLDLVVTESGTDTFYLAVVLPGGRMVVSDALSFTA